MLIITLSFFGSNQRQRFILRSHPVSFLMQMIDNRFNIMHQGVHIGEYGVVDFLKNVVRLFRKLLNDGIYMRVIHFFDD